MDFYAIMNILCIGIALFVGYRLYKENKETKDREKKERENDENK